jgi:hypothetical protein
VRGLAYAQGQIPLMGAAQTVYSEPAVTIQEHFDYSVPAEFIPTQLRLKSSVVLFCHAGIFPILERNVLLLAKRVV